MRARGPIFMGLVLAACSQKPPPVPPASSIAVPWLAPPPPLPPPEPVNACAAPAPTTAPHLSVRAHYVLGPSTRVEARCDRLSAWSPEGGTRLLDPRTGASSERLTHDSPRDLTRDTLLGTGALALWNDTKLEAIDRIDLKPRWNVPRADHGLVFSVANLLIEQSGKACSPKCAIIAHHAQNGHEAWRRACPCDADHAQGVGTPELYEEMHAVDGKIIATQGSARGLDVWDAADGGDLWEKRDVRGEVIGRFIVVDDPSAGVTLFDANGKTAATLHPARKNVEAFAADGDTFFVSSSDAPDLGGPDRVEVESFDVRSGKRLSHGTLEHVVRSMNGAAPELWISGDRVYYFEVGNGFLFTLDRSGKVLSSLGVGDRRLVRTMTGFVSFDEPSGDVEILEPSDAPSPAPAKVRVQGRFAVDKQPMPNIELVVGNVRTKTNAAGRYAATLEARGRFWVRVKQPTSHAAFVQWAAADRVVEVDGRSGTYETNLEAFRDYLE